VVGHDVVIVGERHLADGTLPVLLNNFSIEQFPHFRFGAKLAVPSGMVRVADRLERCFMTRLSLHRSGRRLPMRNRLQPVLDTRRAKLTL
jgi:hypothetical protein